MEDITSSVLNGEVKLWLKSALLDENLENFTAKVVGATEKGDGYIGDVLFVDVTGTTKQGTTKEYNLVLKCSKRSAALREKTPVKIAYLNEIYVYENIIPALTKFQMEKNIEKPFDSVPKFYGTFVGEGMEVLVLQNLKKIGYELWERRTPMNLKHSLAVVKEYGRLHAVSVAFQDQRPAEFEAVVGGIEKVLEAFMGTVDFVKFYREHVEYVIDALEGDVDVKLLEGWRRLVDNLVYICGDLMLDNSNRLNVITHGDCWNNNFMFSYDGDKTNLDKIAVLDWQLCRYSTPIMDLSYFLFTTTSEDGFENFDTILKMYHKSFSNHLQHLGSDPKLYPYEQFITDWRKYCGCGIMMCNFIIKICLTEKEEVKGIDEIIESGAEMADSFKGEIKNKDAYLRRMKYIIQYALDNNLV